MRALATLAAALLSISLLSGCDEQHEQQGYERGQSAYNKGDYPTAVREWRPLAKQGNADAQFFLGSMYDHGEGVPQNYAEAVRWYRLAAEQGHAIAQHYLGAMYSFGQGVPQNYALAYMWSNLAAAQGETEASTSRDSIAERMTPEQIARAQQMSQECLDRNYQGCEP